jgi:hypothetical protein
LCPLKARRKFHSLNDREEHHKKIGYVPRSGYPDCIFNYIEEKFEELHDLLPHAKMYAHLIEAPEVYVIGWDEWCTEKHGWVQRWDKHSNIRKMSEHLDELDDRKDVQGDSVWSALINESQDSPCHPFLETFAKRGSCG